MNRKHPLAECERCPLATSGKYCPSTGPSKAEIAVVGEKPSIHDVQAEKVFTGRTGKLLNMVLDHHYINPEEVFFTNSIACTSRGDVPDEAISACRPRLLAELAEHEPTTVYALGNQAALGVMGRDKVTQLRVGPPKDSPYEELKGVKIIPTINPAMCFRNTDQFPHLIADIGKVYWNVRPWTEPSYVVSDGVDHAIGLMDVIDEKLRASKGFIVIDIEVDVEKDTAFDHPDQYGMLCVGLGYERGKAVVLSEGDMASPEVRDRLRCLLQSHRIVGQNGKFDLSGLYPLLGKLKIWFDTMLASYVFDERPGIHGLKYMAVEYLGAPKYDDEIARYVTAKSGYGVIPRPVLYKYNAYDIVCTYDLCEMFLKRFDLPENAGLRRVHDFLVDASNELMFVELNGFKVDTEHLRRLGEEYRASLLDIERNIDGIVTKDYDKAGGINPRSPLQVKKVLADWGIRVDSTNEDTLELALKKLSPGSDATKFIQELLHHRSETKAYGTYVKGIHKRLYRGRVHSSYLLHGTTTGRLSSRNPNMQNIPRDKRLRSLFIASKPERVLIQTDYSQAELRVLSYLANDTYFRDIFNAGDKDVFDDLTPILYPGSVKENMSPGEWKELRIRVKAYVYGLSYGRSASTIATEYNIPRREAQLGMDRFFGVIPEIVEFREETRQKVKRGEDLITPWGRHRRYALITKETVSSIMNEALAFLPQSTASDMCLNALVRVRQETAGFAWIRNTIHDAIIIECHEDDVEEVTQIQERAMIESAESIVGDYVKFAVDTTVGKSWGELL